MKVATIYEYKDKMYVHSNSCTTAGVWLLSAPVVAVAKEPFAEVGRAIRECLVASRVGIPHPSSFPNLFGPVLALAGVKSYGAFAKLAKCVEVTTVDGVAVTLTPTRNLGARGGFTDLIDKATMEHGPDVALGRAAMAAMAASE